MNAFVSKEDFRHGLYSVIDPLVPFFKNEHLGKLKLGSHGSVYSNSTRGVEAFLRPLWGVGPLLVDENHDDWMQRYIEGIDAGTDPNHDAYWGEVEDYDQLIVEMASLSTFILLNKEKFWDKLDKDQQNNIHRWLLQVNQRKIPKNNWYFFRILINTAMRKCGMPYSQAQIHSDFQVIDSFYRSNGWYCDGKDTQRDYYVAFAMHYYGLLYARFMKDDDKKRSTILVERAIYFAKTFKHWFDASGEGLPFGRSLTYRFAQVSFFSALVFADVEALPWAEVKGLLSRHLRKWFSREIVTSNGLLTVGYHYENLVFAEGYNAYGSPYWALKSFLVLAVPDSHPFWKAEPEPLSLDSRYVSVVEGRSFLQHNRALTHLQAFPAGQYVMHQSHANSKYSKFVYSTVFGFSVSKQDYWYYEGAYDSVLALAKDGHYFRPKNLDKTFELLSDRIIHVWEPWKDVQVKSTIIPFETCHVRIHEIESTEDLTAYEGGFSVPFYGSMPEAEEWTITAESDIGTSIVDAVYGFESVGVVLPEPNTNLFFQRTILPFALTTLKAGKSLLISVISGITPNEEYIRPKIEYHPTRIIITQGERKVYVNVSAAIS